jgi:hypothetical protein
VGLVGAGGRPPWDGENVCAIDFGEEAIRRIFLAVALLRATCLSLGDAIGRNLFWQIEKEENAGIPPSLLEVGRPADQRDERTVESQGEETIWAFLMWPAPHFLVHLKWESSANI